MRLYLRLAWRNVWRHRRRTFLVTIAIAFTLALMLFYDGMIEGFEDAIYGNAIRVLGGNIQVRAVGYSAQAAQPALLPLPDDAAVIATALAQPQVVAASRRIVTSGMVTGRKGAFAVTIVGIEPDAEQPISLVAQRVAAGRLLTANDGDAIYIGQGLADAMELVVGDRITLVGRASHQQMRQRTMTVVGIYDVGLTEVERSTVYLSLREAQTLYGLEGQATEVMVSLAHLGQEASVTRALALALPGVEVATWATSYPELQQAIQTKSGIMNIFGLVMLVIVGIGIFNR